MSKPVPLHQWRIQYWAQWVIAIFPDNGRRRGDVRIWYVETIGL